MSTDKKYVQYLIVDTTAFIQNAPLQDIGTNILSVQEVVDEITNKRQLRRLVTLPYDLVIKDVFPENVRTITEFSKKTGDYPNLSATDIKVMALTYQLHKTEVGTEGLRTEPVMQQAVTVTEKPKIDLNGDLTGFYLPKNVKPETEMECNEEEIEEDSDGLVDYESESNSDCESDDEGWITPSNISKVKEQINSELIEEKFVKVACLTTDFAMQNVLKQMNLNVAALDGRMIKQLKTFILRCYTCFGTTSIMTKTFCPKCGNKTLKRVGVSLDKNGLQKIHINAKHPLSGRGKRFSVPTFKGGKHSNNPRVCADQPMPDQRPTRLARMKNNPLNEDYVAGFSPFIMRDVNSKSAQLCIRPNSVKSWSQRNSSVKHKH